MRRLDKGSSCERLHHSCFTRRICTRTEAPKTKDIPLESIPDLDIESPNDSEVNSPKKTVP